VNLLLFGTRVPAFAAVILLLSGLSQMLFSQSQAAVKRSEIRVYTLADKTVKTVYAADKLIEAPNWSPDGSYLLVNTGGDLRPDDLAARHWPLARTPQTLETSLPGVFAVGDVRSGSMKRVASAVGEGSAAVALVHRILQEQGAQ